jgi:hypothetical protein
MVTLRGLREGGDADTRQPPPPPRLQTRPTTRQSPAATDQFVAADQRNPVGCDLRQPISLPVHRTSVRLY